MSASEHDPTVVKTIEYSAEGSFKDRDTSYIQMMEQIKSLTATVSDQANTIAELTRELEWFRRNMFGKRSETSRRFEDNYDPGVRQMSLFD